MNAIAELALILSVPIGLGLYLMLPARRATLAVFIGGWLFLPVTGFEFQGLPNYSKITAIALTVLVGTLMAEPRRLLTFRPGWVDVPMAVWCGVPFVTALTNDLGWYDGLSMVFTQTVLWGVPWLMGRVWFSDAEGMRELAIGVLLGALVYVPLCLYEVRMSPHLHAAVYGVESSPFAQVQRFGGYRPLVFMRRGLEVGLWMSAGTLVGLWLWSSGTLRRLFGVPMAPLVAMLGVTALLCKSLGAILLMFVGAGLLYAAKWTRLAIPALLVALMVPGYVVVRASGLWSGEEAVRGAAVISEPHAESLEFRLHHEDMLAARALERPVFGWGGWGRSRVTDERGEDISVTDGLWIIALGHFGSVGLAAVTAVVLLPILLLYKRCPARWWRGPPAVLAVIVLLFAVDSLLNAMPNPMYLLAAGAVCGMPGEVMRAVGAMHVAAAARGAAPAIDPQADAARAAPVARVRPAQPGGAVRPIAQRATVRGRRRVG